MAAGKLSIVSDSACVVNGIDRKLRGVPIRGTKHLDLWGFLQEHISFICAVKWIKAHLPNLAKAQLLGYTEDEWQGTGVLTNWPNRERLCIHAAQT